MVLKKESRVLQLDLKAVRGLTSRCLGEGSQSPPPLFLQQGHTYSNKTTPPNSVTPRAKHIQITIDAKMVEVGEGGQQ